MDIYEIVGAVLCAVCTCTGGIVPYRYTLLTGIPGLILLFS